jgi:hypothetical protein
MPAAIFNELPDLLQNLEAPGYFCTEGSAELPVMRLEIQRLGLLALPILPFQAEALLKLAELILSNPTRWSMDRVVIPTLTDLSPSIRSMPAVQSLRTAALKHLQTRMALPLAPFADAGRDSSVIKCGCEHCSRVKVFLEDPVAREWRIKVATGIREHITTAGSGADLVFFTEKRGTPYTLVCTKSEASYARRVQERVVDRDLVEKLGW